MMHTLYYAPMTVNKIHPPFYWCHNFCLADRTPCWPGRREEAACILIFLLFNLISWVILTSHNDNERLLPAGTSRQKPHHPPTPSHPPFLTHSVSSPPPSLPVTQLCSLLNADKATLGKKKKGLNEKCFGPPSNKCLMQKQKKTDCSFHELIFIFWRKETHPANCRMRGQETGDGNVLDLG